MVGKGFGLVASGEEGVADTLRGEVAKDPFDEGLAGDGGHGLGDFAKEVAHAGALTAREQKGQYDEAKADLAKAAELAPEDKAVPKLMTRVEAQIARQKAKEKKMYGKMFG